MYVKGEPYGKKTIRFTAVLLHTRRDEVLKRGVRTAELD